MIEKHVTNVEDSKRLEKYKEYLSEPLFWWIPVEGGYKIVSYYFNEDCVPCYLASQLIEAFPYEFGGTFWEVWRGVTFNVQGMVNGNQEWIVFESDNLLTVLTDAIVYCGENNLF